jgi:DNA-binding protein H-NS
MPRFSSAAVIRARIRALEVQARRLEQDGTRGLRAAVTLIRKHRLSLADLRQAFAMSKGRGAKASPLIGRSVAPKYRDDKGNAWTGRGRVPLWLVAAEKAGRKRESFLIGAKKTKTKSGPKKSAAKKASAKKHVSEPAAAQSA